jgi:hypothetical protein
MKRRVLWILTAAGTGQQAPGIADEGRVVDTVGLWPWLVGLAVVVDWQGDGRTDGAR